MAPATNKRTTADGTKPGPTKGKGKGAPKPAPEVADLVIRFTYEGQVTDLVMGGLGATDERLVRRETGERLTTLMSEVVGDTIPLDVMAVLWWLARYHEGETELALADVEGSVTISDHPTVEMLGLDDIESGASGK